jgi:hypothetical protein
MKAVPGAKAGSTSNASLKYLTASAGLLSVYLQYATANELCHKNNIVAIDCGILNFCAKIFTKTKLKTKIKMLERLCEKVPSKLKIKPRLNRCAKKCSYITFRPIALHENIQVGHQHNYRLAHANGLTQHPDIHLILNRPAVTQAQVV